MSFEVKYLLSIVILVYSSATQLVGQSKRLIIPNSSSQQFFVERWSTDEGLPANTLLHLHKSQKGYIWIASFEGLVKFDGIEFKTYTRAKDGILSNAIAQVEEDSKGKIWISTYGEGIMSYDNGVFRSENDEQLKNQSIQKIYVDSQDRIWIGTRGKGVYVHSNGKVTKIKGHPAIENITISAFAEAKDGSMWIGTEGNGLIKFKNNQFEAHNITDGLHENKIFSLFFDTLDTLWVGTSLGLARFADGSFYTIPDINPCVINTLFEDINYNLWVATDCGLYKKVLHEDQWTRLSLDDIIPSQFYTDALVDDRGHIWVSTYQAGLALIKKSKFINYTIRDGLSTKAISCVEEIGPGKFLIGANNGNINLIDDGEISDYRFNTPLPDTRIRAILHDSQGNLWVGTSMGMLYRRASGQEVWYTTENGLPDNEVRIFYEDKAGHVWFGTRAGGLVRIEKDGSFNIFDKSNKLSSNFIMSIREDNDGNLLVGTNETGLNIIDADDNVRFITKEDGLSSNLIFSTYTDSENTIWITTNAGITRMKNGTFANITAADGMGTDAPFDFVEDESGDVWLPTSKGIIKIRKKKLNAYADGFDEDLNFRLYDNQDGLEVAECTGAAKSLMSSKGRIWIPALNGVFVINPKDITYNSTPPPVFITQLTLDGQTTYAGSDTIKIDADVQRISINFEALNYSSPTKVRYQYRLQNFDKDWITSAEEREVQYTNLRHGTYTFEVIASNEDGVWSKTPSSLTLIIDPKFYETSSFISMVILLLIVLIFSLFRYSVYNVERRNKVLTELVENKTSELRDTNSRLEEQKEELLVQHDLLAYKNLELENAHLKISQVNEALTRVNSQLEEKVEERTKDLSATLEKLKASNEELDIFIYRASHDLKGPTASLLGLAMLGKVISDDARYTDFFNRIEDTSHNMNNILGKLISMHTILHTHVTQVKIDINALLREIQDNLKINPLTYKLINNCSQNIEILTDSVLLKIILKNLIENAIIFNSRGEQKQVTVDIKYINSSLQLIVEDNGDGIEPDIKRRVFDLFYRGSQRSKGNGLGLYLVKKAVEKLAGDIKLESDVGKFTRFTVTLPIHF